MPQNNREENSFKKAAFSSDDERSAKEKMRKDQMSRTRITVHRKLIREEDEESYLIRIPGENFLIRIKKEDTYLYRSGEILSAFLYDNVMYPAYTADGNLCFEKSGREVKVHFDKKEDRFRSKGR